MANTRDDAARLADSPAVKRVALLLVLACSIAHAEERATTVTLAGMAGAFAPADRDKVPYEPDGVMGPRLTLSWEYAPLAMPDAPGYRFGGSLVPELFGGALVDDTRAQGFIGAGVRAELKMAQREQGLLKVSARGAAYLAARGMVVGDQRKPFGELAIGDYFVVGRSSRLGFEGSLLVGRPDEMTMDHSPKVGGLVLLYVGWTP